MDVIEEILRHQEPHAEEENGSGDEGSRVLRAHLARILDALHEDCSDVIGTVVSGVDGMAWAQRLPAEFDQNRFAAMSSALLALSDNLVKEAGEGSPRKVLIEGEGGNVFLMHAGSRLLLTVFTRADSNLGMSLAHANHAVERIAALMARCEA